MINQIIKVFFEIYKMIKASYDIVIINKRKLWKWLYFEIFRNDWKIFNIVWKTFRFKNDILTIRTYYSEHLPVVINISKEFLIDNRKKDDMKKN